MALSLLYNPVDYSSAHGDLIFTLLEDTKPFASNLYPDYKYVCDVYIGGTLAARLKSFPRPGDKIGVFNIGNIVRNYITVSFRPISGIHYDRLAEGSFYVNVTCRFGEEYNNTTFSNIIVDTQRSYFNHYNGRQFGTSTILQNYLDKVISSRPYATNVFRGATHNLIPFLSSDDTQIDGVIKCYNQSLGLVRQGNFTAFPDPTSANEVQQFNIAPQSLNGSIPGLIDNIIDYYIITFGTTNIVDDSIYRFNIVCESRYEVFPIHFLNKYGGFESKEFTKVSRRKIDIEKSSFGSSQYIINSSGLPEYYSAQKVYQESNKVYADAWKEKMVLNSDLLKDDEYIWLEELVLSPMAFIEINSYFFPITITDTNYEAKKVINDDLTNLTINIEFGDRFNTQYR